ncbi:MAG: heme o synthase [Cyanobacteria bacterium LVE1205-1]|jgi:protoheme IX farnesyltransferase
MTQLTSSVTRHHENLWQLFQSYYQLTKPRIILLLLITTAGGMWVASKGQVDVRLLLITLLGGAMAAASANTINCIYDRDIDYIMERTRHRPLPSGRIQPRDAVIFAVVLALLSFSLLTSFANLLSALLAQSGIACYVCIYTHWLKRHHTQNIVIGGVAGAIPPLVGWAAVTGQLDWPAWVLFAIVFFWTPPHFWALAMMIRDDYAKVGVPMLPVVAGEKLTALQIWFYTLLLIPITLLLVYPFHVMGALYTAIALGLGGVFVHKSWKLRRDPSDLSLARSLFKYSILYMILLCAGMGVDSLPITHGGEQFLREHLQTFFSTISGLMG